MRNQSKIKASHIAVSFPLYLTIRNGIRASAGVSFLPIKRAMRLRGARNARARERHQPGSRIIPRLVHQDINIVIYVIITPTFYRHAQTTNNPTIRTSSWAQAASLRLLDNWQDSKIFQMTPFAYRRDNNGAHTQLKFYAG